jgi:hypothetical protein
MWLVGLFLTLGTTFAWLGRMSPKVYKFIHMYNRMDTADNETYVIGRLSNKDVTQLRRDAGNKSIRDVFKNTPVLLYLKEFVKLNKVSFVTIKGYVYASSEIEAKAILSHEGFDDSLQYDEEHSLIN